VCLFLIFFIKKMYVFMVYIIIKTIIAIFEAGRERTKRIIKKEYPSINLNKPPSSIASLSNYTPRNKKIEEKTNKNDKDHKSTVYKRTTFRLPIREPSAQNFDMYYYLAPNQEPATVTNILELYDEIKSKLIEKKKAKVFCTNKLIISKEPILKNKDNYINITNNKTNLLSASTKLSKTSLPLSNKENHPSHQKKMGKENKGILTKSNMNNSNILKPSTKIDNLKGTLQKKLLHIFIIILLLLYKIFSKIKWHYILIN